MNSTFCLRSRNPTEFGILTGFHGITTRILTPFSVPKTGPPEWTSLGSSPNLSSTLVPLPCIYILQAMERKWCYHIQRWYIIILGRTISKASATAVTVTLKQATTDPVCPEWSSPLMMLAMHKLVDSISQLWTP